MSRRPKAIQFQFPGMEAAAKQPDRQPMPEHTCTICQGRASFGYDVKLLHGREGTWYCYQHWPDKPHRAEEASAA